MPVLPPGGQNRKQSFMSILHVYFPEIEMLFVWNSLTMYFREFRFDKIKRKIDKCEADYDKIAINFDKSALEIMDSTKITLRKLTSVYLNVMWRVFSTTLKFDTSRHQIPHFFTQKIKNFAPHGPNSEIKRTII